MNELRANRYLGCVPHNYRLQLNYFGRLSNYVFIIKHIIGACTVGPSCVKTSSQGIQYAMYMYCNMTLYISVVPLHFVCVYGDMCCVSYMIHMHVEYCVTV